jgi:hypothetical protein
MRLTGKEGRIRFFDMCIISQAFKTTNLSLHLLPPHSNIYTRSAMRNSVGCRSSHFFFIIVVVIIIQEQASYGLQVYVAYSPASHHPRPPHQPSPSSHPTLRFHHQNINASPLTRNLDALQTKSCLADSSVILNFPRLLQ